MEQYFIFPIANYWLTCDYLGYKGHQGIDIGWSSKVGSYKQEVYASKSGVVVDSNYRSDSGNYVVIQHDDGSQRQWTRYLHLDSRKVNKGDEVKQGDVIGIRGNTGTSSGAHLHFQMSPIVSTVKEYNRDWCALNGIDPKPYLYKSPKIEYYLDSETMGWLKDMPSDKKDYKKLYEEAQAKLEKIRKDGGWV